MDLKKLWYSYQKELLLSSKSWYFAIEIGMAVIILLILLVVMPENFNQTATEYIYMNMDPAFEEALIEKQVSKQEGATLSVQSLEIKDVTYTVQQVKLEGKVINYLEDSAALVAVSETLQKPVVEVTLGADQKPLYTYHLQGYESDKLKNLLLMLHSNAVDTTTLEAQLDTQTVTYLNPKGVKLSDRENFLPMFLTLNGSFMSLFIIAAYVFLDRQEGIIKAYAVTASSVSNYLISKSAVVVTTSLLSSVITLVPIMQLKINYGFIVLLLVPSAFFAAFVGLILTSFYKNISQSFGALFAVIVLMMLPTISYMLPSWEPLWIKFIPTFYLLQAFKEVLMGFGSEDTAYILLTALSFALASIPLFLIAKWRFKHTLTQ